MVVGAARQAEAALGDLTYIGCITGEARTGPSLVNGDGHKGNCSVFLPHISETSSASGLDTPQSVAITADGTSVYAASQDNAAVWAFSRNSAGVLTPLGCITGDTRYGPSGSGACTAISHATADGTNSGLSLLRSVTVSPDGKNVYAVSGGDDAVARFARNTSTGTLTYVDCLTGEIASGSSGTVACAQAHVLTSGGSSSGIDNPSSVAVSPDNTSVYVVTEDDQGVMTFDRDTTSGALTYDSCISGESPLAGIGCALTPGADTDGAQMTGAYDVAITPQGDSVYVAADAAALIGFDRNATTGTLSFHDCLTGNTLILANQCTRIPKARAAAVSSGMQGLSSVAISSDGRSLYAAATSDDAIAGFTRDPATRDMSYGGCISGATQLGSTGTNACTLSPSATSFGTDSGLDGPTSVAVSPDGGTVYASVRFNDAIATFDRERTTGAFTWAQCITARTSVGPAGTGACAATPTIEPTGADSGMSGPMDVIVSPDGKSLYTVALNDDSIVRFDREAADPKDVLMEDDSFLPATVTVRLGGFNTVRWTNDGDNAHNATRTSAAFPFAISVAPDDSADLTFPFAGSFPYVCTLHKGMAGTIKVALNVPTHVAAGGSTVVSWAEAAAPAGTGFDVQLAAPGKKYKTIKAATTDLSGSIPVPKKGTYKLRTRVVSLPNNPKASSGWSPAVKFTAS